MRVPRWWPTSRRLVWSFLAVTLVPLLALIWLAAELARQDRQLEQQRAQALAEDAADRIVARLHQRAAELTTGSRLTRPGDAPPAGTTRIVVDPDRITVTPPGSMVWLPVLPAADTLPRETFEIGERYELQEGDAAKAIDWYTRLARNDRPAVRAGALVRLGRTQKKSGQPDAALATYRTLALLGGVQVEGYSSAVLALAAQCEIFEQLGRREELTAAARALRDGLAAGTWPLLREAYEYYDAEAGRWTGEPKETVADRDRRAEAAAFQAVYARWTADGSVPETEWRTVEGRPILTVAVTHQNPRQLSVLVAGSTYLGAAWNDAPGLDVSIADQQGHVLLGGALTSTGPKAVRTSDVSQLPWTLWVTSSRGALPTPALAQRRLLLAAGLGLVLLLVGGSAYFSWRGIGHEVAVARLQSDFVGAVSHEFRSPIASIRHLSEMLATGRMKEGWQREQAYEFLSRESERLELLVEELLDLGRLESGTYEYHFEHLDAVDLVRATVADFTQNAAAAGYCVDLSAACTEASVLADREALRRALWNLLDNAVKYSPDERTVWVSVETQGAAVAIQVRDQGLGISAREQSVIFRKFVRGTNTRERQIKGTGIGLAMVGQIVEAHHGAVLVHSRPSHGSTFVMRIPIEMPA